MVFVSLYRGRLAKSCHSKVSSNHDGSSADSEYVKCHQQIWGFTLFFSSGKMEKWLSLSVLSKFQTLLSKTSLQYVWILVNCFISSETSQLFLLPTSIFSRNVILLSFIASLHDILSHAKLWSRVKSCRLKGHSKVKKLFVFIPSLYQTNFF